MNTVGIAAAPPGLRRHRLAFLTPGGWDVVLRSRIELHFASKLRLHPPLDSDLASELRRWADRGLPLVVTRQSAAAAPDQVALGWQASLACARRRLAFSVATAGIARLEEFPPAAEAIGALPSASRASIGALLRRLDVMGTTPRVYGSHGWQRLSGLPYVHPRSDLDLWLSVRDLGQADAAVAALEDHDSAELRVDGELVGPDGRAVAWREYSAWRAGRSRALLTKRLDGVALGDRLDWPLGDTASVRA